LTKKKFLKKKLIEVNKSKYLEEVHSLNDIKWEDSVDIFKDLNELHIFYRLNSKHTSNNANTTKKVNLNLLKSKSKSKTRKTFM
jgi:hypothetical protein